MALSQNQAFIWPWDTQQGNKSQLQSVPYPAGTCSSGPGGKALGAAFGFWMGWSLQRQRAANMQQDQFLATQQTT